MAYIGQSLTEGTRRVYTYVATASQTTFNAVYGVGAVDVYQNGVLLTPDDYTASTGTSVVLDTAAALDDEITIICHNTFSVADTVSASQGGTFNNDITVSGDLTVDANTLHVDSANNRVGVGVATPQAKLDVTGNVAGEHGAFIYNGNASGYSALRLGNSDRGTNGDHLVYGGSALGFSSKTGTGIAFNPSNNQAMRIDANGYTVVRNNMMIGEADTVSTFQGATIRNAKDSSAATTVSFIDAQNNLGTADAHMFFDHNTDGSSAIIFGTTPAGSRSSDRRQERMRILPTGGITFNGDTTQDNALNDYEEGTWNAIWTNQYGQTIFDQSPSAQMSRYTKVGDTVHATAYFSMPGAFGPTASYVAGAALRIGGLPFTASRQGGSDYYAGAVGWYQGIANYAAGYTPMCYVESGTSTIQVVFANGAYTTAFVQSNAYNSSSGMMVSVSYKTAS